MPGYADGSYSTPASKALIAKILAGRCQMEYTRAALGKGSIPEGMRPGTMTEPADYVMDAKIAAASNPVDGECLVWIQVKSSDVARGFDCTGVVLYAKDPDLGDVPFTYVVLENDPERIRPASSAVGKVFDIEVISAVDEVDSVKGSIDPDIMATIGQVRQLIREHNEDPEAHSLLVDAVLNSEKLKRLFADHNLDPEAHPDIRDEIGKGGGGGGSVTSTVIVIPDAGWQASGEEGYPYCLTLPCDLSTAASVPDMALYRDSMDTATVALLCPTINTLDGAIQLWAKKKPTADIKAKVTFYGPCSYVSKLEVTIPADGWQMSEDERYPLTVDVPVEDITAELEPKMALYRQSIDVAAAAGLCPTVETVDGALRFHAKQAPAGELKASLTLFKVMPAE